VSWHHDNAAGMRPVAAAYVSEQAMDNTFKESAWFM
jgi:hypothetical protein